MFNNSVSFRAFFLLPRGPVIFFSWERKFRLSNLTLQRYDTAIAVLESFSEKVSSFRFQVSTMNP